MKKIILPFFLSSMLLFSLAEAQSIKGSWRSQQPNNSIASLIIADNYLMIASYSILNKYFDRTEGGSFTMDGDKMTYLTEFNTGDTAKINKSVVYTVTRKDKVLTLRGEDRELVWMLVDDAADVPMAGTWHITGRAKDGTGEMMQIHQTGTRKTLKILSGTRFQWAAIDPAVKGFYGTGGGTYEIKNGQYTETIQFFSRDNYRVGNELTFDWALKDGVWDHAGKSSKGDPIHEVWQKIE